MRDLVELITVAGFNMEADFDKEDFRHSFQQLKHFPTHMHFSNQINLQDCFVVVYNYHLLQHIIIIIRMVTITTRAIIMVIIIIIIIIILLIFSLIFIDPILLYIFISNSVIIVIIKLSQAAIIIVMTSNSVKIRAIQTLKRNHLLQQVKVVINFEQTITIMAYHYLFNYFFVKFAYPVIPYKFVLNPSQLIFADQVTI